MTDNFHSSECALRRDGQECTCGFSEREAHKSLNKAINLAVHALEDYRRKHYAAPNHAAQFGLHFGEEGKKKYDEYTQAIECLKKLLKGKKPDEPRQSKTQ